MLSEEIIYCLPFAKFSEIELTQWRSSAAGHSVSRSHSLEPGPLRTWGREAFSLEDVAQMPATRSAGDLRARHAVRRVVVAVHGPGDRCSCISTATGRRRTPHAPSKNAGQPHPLSNLVVLLYSGVPQPAHV